MSPDRLRVFTDTEEALERFPKLIQTGDSILVKGSRAMGLERLVDALAELESAEPRGGPNGPGTRFRTGTVS